MPGGSSKAGPKHQRRRGTRTEKRTFLVYCEGLRTETDYLEALKEVPEIRDRASVEVHIDYEKSGQPPMKLVEAAVDGPGAEDEDDEIDEVWCVFDVEWPTNHPKLDEALDLAQSRGIRTAISNPCFEYWLVLHFDQPLEWLTTAEACDLRQSLDQSDGKEVDGAQYMPRRSIALRRARYIERRHANDGNEFPCNNPSTGMHALLAAIEEP
ncbi:MAG: RloB family protein [Acidimicrobiaceae bacterium]|nr:RloB family protein [Acidimicrobiaceae bacterium]